MNRGHGGPEEGPGGDLGMDIWAELQRGQWQPHGALGKQNHGMIQDRERCAKALRQQGWPVGQ